MTARALTILETLIVLALIGAAAAMAAPAMTRLIAPVTFEEACAQCEHAVRLAASEARLRGDVMAVVALPHDDVGRSALVAVPLDRLGEGLAREASTTLVVLPRGVTVRGGAEATEGPRPNVAAEAPPGSVEEPGGVVMAYALPDGTVLAGVAVEIEMEGRVAEASATAMGARLSMRARVAGDEPEGVSGVAGLAEGEADGAGGVDVRGDEGGDG